MNLLRHSTTFINTTVVAVLAALCGLLTVAACEPAWAAERDEGFYAGAGAGFGRLGNAEKNEFTVDFHDQWYADAFIGKRWSSGLMVELWARYGRNGVAEGGGFEGTPATAGTLNIMPCVLYEHDTALTIDPFVGACMGLGYAGLDAKGRDAFPQEGESVNIADLFWSWGFRGGLAADLTDDGRYRVRVQYAYVCNEGGSWTGVDHVDRLCTHGAGAQFLMYFNGAKDFGGV